MKIESRYLDGSYFEKNPDWDRKDAEWKAAQIAGILKAHSITPQSICEVGCGSGDILLGLKRDFPASTGVGYEISPQAAALWTSPAHSPNAGMEFVLGDFHELNRARFDVLLMIDVFEHVRDPFTFLEASRAHARHFVFHIPLDLSAVGVLRSRPLLEVREKVGHLHFYTKDLALETLKESGYRIIEWRYTGASLNSPSRALKTRLASVPRRLAYSIDRDWGVRLFGGETLIVLAE